ncbi:hypothetical protein [Accumulibacter sp.]|uniref:hypothetical protein n=1 Tax=Accumulibacter sp. TaxID=2053492 RepID=UPI0025D78EAB|nr:hypothetical protein [Accumulibacter sp.]MCM8595738.1 hypothetical protein [Accumulibacter sp.]MCM8625384.1 hypothetical protein [Accumulibacter sp.]MDS4049885.1 hypothetical protein [Accumulibacter sp.]
MNVVERSFRLEGPSGLGAKPRPELIGPVLTRLHDTLLDAVRMGFMHSSHPRGRIPRGIKAAADVRYISHSQADDNATLLRFEVAPFGDVAADLFMQARLWDDMPTPDQTAFELLGAALDDIGTRREESNRFDPALLRRIARYKAIFRQGLSRIVLPDVAAPRPSQFDAAVVDSAHALSSATPLPRRVRVNGRLDLMGVSQGVIKIHVAGGAVVTALWDSEEPIAELRSLLNRDVVCEGMGVFRPSGALLRIDADAVAAAGPGDAGFAVVPRAPRVGDIKRQILLKSGEASAYRDLMGSIPAEESDEDFASAIEIMS